MDIDSTNSPIFGVVYNKYFNRWSVNTTYYDIKMEFFSVKKYGFRKAKLICCQLLYTKFLLNNTWELERDIIINYFNDLKNK